MNTKPFWQSKTIIACVGVILAFIAQLLGVQDQAAAATRDVSAVVQTVGANLPPDATLAIHKSIEAHTGAPLASLFGIIGACMAITFRITGKKQLTVIPESAKHALWSLLPVCAIAACLLQTGCTSAGQFFKAHPPTAKICYGKGDKQVCAFENPTSYGLDAKVHGFNGGVSIPR